MKTEKIVKNELKEYGLQTKSLISYFFVHLIFAPISIAIIYYAIEGNPLIQLFALLSVVYLLFLYFFPTVIAFDFLQNYKDQNIPQLKHPFRWVIFFSNLILGGTGIIWLILYFWSFLPGKVVVEIITFEKVDEEKNKPEIKPSGVKNDLAFIIEELDKLRDLNLITDDEFNLKKGLILKEEDKEIEKFKDQNLSFQIKEFDNLRQKGLINNNEFEIKKKDILGI